MVQHPVFLKHPVSINKFFLFTAKTSKEGKLEACKAIQKVEWKSSKTG